MLAVILLILGFACVAWSAFAIIEWIMYTAIPLLIPAMPPFLGGCVVGLLICAGIGQYTITTGNPGTLPMVLLDVIWLVLMFFAPRNTTSVSFLLGCAAPVIAAILVALFDLVRNGNFKYV
jgi:hypothetical protein